MQTTLQLPQNVGLAFQSRARQHSSQNSHLHTLNPCPKPIVPHRNHNVKMSANVKIKDYGNAGNFEIPEEQKALLEQMLSSPSFCEQVGVNANLPADKVNRVEFTGLLFQPVPWSPSTKKGMPQVSPSVAFSFSPPSLLVFLTLALHIIYRNLSNTLAVTSTSSSMFHPQQCSKQKCSIQVAFVQCMKSYSNLKRIVWIT